jgi:hypothetical protein
MEEIKIDIAIDFNPKLGGRWKTLGPFSGEEFYENILKPKYLLTIENCVELHIYLDGAKGYGSSFLDQSFGELAREFGLKNVKDKIFFHTTLFQWNVDYIMNEIWRED